jgi:hypothetical protein
MPGKLRALLVVMGLAVLWNVGVGLMGGGTAWVSAVIGVLLAVGVLRGNEGVRTLLIGLAALGLLFGAIGILLGLAIAATGSLAGIAVLGGSVIGAGQNAFTIWCLRQTDVQHWMFNKSLKDVAGV